MARERLAVADVHQPHDEIQGILKARPGFATALYAEGEYAGSVPAHVFLHQRMIPMIGQAGIIHPGHLGLRLEELRDLPGLEELKGAGLLSGRIPQNFQVPMPLGEDEFAEDEDPITQLDLEELGLLTPGGKEDE